MMLGSPKYRVKKIQSPPFFLLLCLVLSLGMIACKGKKNDADTSTAPPPQPSGDKTYPLPRIGPPALFNKNELLPLTIKGPVQAFLEERETGVRLPVQLQLGGATIKADLELKGRFRFTWCRYPPLGIELTEDANGTPFESIEEIKIYPHCDRYPMPSNPDKLVSRFIGQENIVYREQFPYEIWRIISGAGHGTRLAMITYQDTEGAEAVTAAALISETHKDLARRYGGRRIKEDDGGQRQWSPAERLKEADSQAAALHQLFQVLLGNHDWEYFDINLRPPWRMSEDPKGKQMRFMLEAGELQPSNVVVIRLLDGRLIPEPYDFDLSPMAIGYPDDRADPRFADGFYTDKSKAWQDTFLDAQGRFRPRHARQDVDFAIERFRTKREAIEEALDASRMDVEGKAIARRRLANFYEIIEPETFFRDTIVRKDVSMYADQGGEVSLCTPRPGVLLQVEERGPNMTKIRITDGHRRACRDKDKTVYKLGWVAKDAVSKSFPPTAAELGPLLGVPAAAKDESKKAP